MRLVRVNDRAAGSIAVVSGVVAAWSGVAPIGARSLDAVVVFLAVAAVTWASASAPWWVITTVAGIGTMLAIDPVLTAVGAATWVAALWIGTQRRDHSQIRAVLGGLAANVLCRLEFEWFLGSSALVGVALGLSLVVFGLRRRHSVIRRWARRSAIGMVGLAALAAVGVGIAGLNARADVTAGKLLVTEGIELLRDGDYPAAAERFDRAASAFSAARSTIERPWTQPARLLPIAAQNRRAVSTLADRAAVASADLANAALFIDPSALRVTDGRFDLDHLAEIEPPLTSAYDSMVELRVAIDRVESPWLVTGIESRLDDAAAEFDDNIDQIESAVQALHLAPELLGATAPRHYFVAFTTPAEARGLGGFMGNYAVLTADAGALSMTDFGRTKDLNDGGTGERRLDPPEEWDALWGRYGFTTGPGGVTSSVPWSNVTISPHFPSTAQVIAELFPQSGGRQVDGVFALDPYALQTMVGFTGPISIDAGEGTERLLTDKNTAQFLLFDQYGIEDTGARADLLEQVAKSVIDELLGGALPGPIVLADQLQPLAQEGRLVAWMSDPAEQALFERIGASGALPQHDGADGFQVVVNNAGANKLDAYLDRAIRYRSETDVANGVVVGTLEVTFTNNGPTEGLPSGVIGNYVGDPVGTNRSLVSVYTALPVTGAAFDGEPIGFESGVEAGWQTSTLFVVLPPGESHTLSFTIAGQLPGPGAPAARTGSYQLVIGTQPLVNPVDYDVEVTDNEGAVVFEFVGRSPGHRRFSSDPGVGSAK